MTCRQLGGACDKEFHADTFELMAELSRAHARIMAEQGDQAHIDAMQRMRERLEEPGAMSEWRRRKQAEFDALPDN